MNLKPYIDSLHQQLAVAAQAGGEEAGALAERLTAPLEAATRLALLEALSAAADEITRELAPGSVDVRLRGGDPDFVVTPPPSGRQFEDTAWDDLGAPPPPPPPPDLDESGTARITLRVPESFKPRIEEAAGREGLSVNAWLVRAVAAALDQGGARRPAASYGGQDVGKRFTGWVR